MKKPAIHGSAFLGMLLCVLMVITAPGSELARVKPNVILIMADDLAYADLSCYGSKTMRTPHLDRLAANGMRFTHFYAGATVCTPSRMALLTGCYPTRLGWPGGVSGHKIPSSLGLSPSVITIGEHFRLGGYRTALVGKWHIGEAPELLPTARGFDDCFYLRASNNQSRELWHNDTIVAAPFDNKRLSEQFTQHAIQVIQQPSTKPFFLYLPYTAPHFPAEAHPDWKNRSNNSAYGDVVEELDARIGEIMTALVTSGHEINTIFVFLSDNGPEKSQRPYNSAAPLRGGKWSSLEGGTRVPLIISFPRVIKAGVTHEQLMAAIDLFPTLAQACGIPIKSEKTDSLMDGMDLWSSITNLSDQNLKRDTLLYWEGWATAQAIRRGDWKLYFDAIEEIPDSQLGPALFHLSNDPAEQRNLAQEHPEMVQSMLKIAREQLNDIQQRSVPMAGKGRSPTPSAAKKPRWLP